MRASYEKAKHVPVTHTKPRQDAAELANKYIREWDEKRLETKEKVVEAAYPPAICLSRKSGVGALVVADILAEKTGYRVVDREILEHIAAEARLSEKTVEIFDERYPGKLSEFLSLAFGEKAFIKSDYARHLFTAVFSIAAMGRNIFVGRGAHLLLPRDRALAVRIISSREFRVKRLAELLDIEETEAERRLDHNDREQKAFYKCVFGKKDASAYEFDMVINCDHISDPDQIARLIESAFRSKFGDEIAGI